MQTLMDPWTQETFGDDESSFPGERHVFLDAATPFDDDLLNNDTRVNLEEEERMFKNAKLYTDWGNECFSNSLLLSS